MYDTGQPDDSIPLTDMLTTSEERTTTVEMCSEETLTMASTGSEETFDILVKSKNREALKSYLLGNQESVEKNYCRVGFNICQMFDINRNGKERTAFRILLEDCEDGVDLVLAYFKELKKENLEAFDGKAKDCLVNDVVELLSPGKEICFMDCQPPSKTVGPAKNVDNIEPDDLRPILENPHFKQLFETSFDGQLCEKIKESKKKGLKILQKFLLRKDANLGRVVMLKYQENDSVQQEDIQIPVRDGRTLFRILLEDVINGHKLVMVLLNNLVVAREPIKPMNDESKELPYDELRDMDDDSEELPCDECLDMDEEEANIQLNMIPLYTKKDQMKLVGDLLDIQSERGSSGHLREIFNHPVIQILILSKWENIKIWHTARIRFFALFVILFTAFIRVKIVDYDYGNLQKQSNTTEILNDTWRTDPDTWLDSWLSDSWLSDTCGGKTSENDTSYFVNSIFNCKKGMRCTNEIVFSIILAAVFSAQSLVFLLNTYSCFDLWRKKKQNEEFTKYMKRKKINSILHQMVNIICLASLFFSFTTKCRLVTVLLILWFIYAVIELLQFWILVLEPVWNGQGKWKDFLKQTFKRNYWNDPENFVQLVCYVTVPIAVFCKITGYDPDGSSTIEICRGLVAAGVCCSWIELIFLLGIPSRTFFGDFITMFYNVVKIKLWTYMQIFFLLAAGFGFSFWILNKGRNGGQNKESDELSFDGFWVSTIIAVTMSIGEFNISDFYKHFDDHNATLIFAMLFLVFLIILSTIAMINLLVAAIISDYKEMKDAVDYQSMVFMTEYIIEVESHLGMIEKTPFSFLSTWQIKKYKVDSNLFFCPHVMCNNEHSKYQQNCKRVPLPVLRANEAEERMEMLEKLVTLRNIMKNEQEEKTVPCKYHKSLKKPEDEERMEMLEILVLLKNRMKDDQKEKNLPCEFD